MTLVILTSGIDLSVGSLLALTGAVAASIVGIEVNALVAVAAALALGAAIGAVTGGGLWRKAACRPSSLPW